MGPIETFTVSNLKIQSKAKVISSIAFTYATALVWFCPCKDLIGCHKSEFFLSLTVGITPILLFPQQF